jgi:hypothetical protein
MTVVTPLGDVLDGDLRGPRGRAAFASSPQDVDVGVDEPGQGRPAVRLDDVDIPAAQGQGVRRDDGLDAAAGDEDVAEAQGTGSIDVGAADEKGQGEPPAWDSG